MASPWEVGGQPLIDRLKELYEGGASCANVAYTLCDEFSVRITRNAVIGKARRLELVNPNPPRQNLQGDRKSRRRSEGARLPGERAPKFNPVKFVCVQADVIPLHVSLTDLQHDQCRWPYGEGPYTFCGCAIAVGSYCYPHYQQSRGLLRTVSTITSEERVAA